MPKIRLAAATAAAALCLVTGLGAGAAQAAVTYTFNVNTSSIAGTTGFIEFQFANGGSFGLDQDATATITNFSSVGGAFTETDPHGVTDIPPIPNVFGDVTGFLPGTVTMGDVANEFDDYLHGFQFGQSFSFQVTLSGPAVDASACTNTSSCSLPAFGLDLLAGDGSGFLLTGDPTGENNQFLLGQVQVGVGGATTLVVNPGPNGGASALAITAAPEPVSWALMLAGFGGIGAMLRRRRAGHLAA